MKNLFFVFALVLVAFFLGSCYDNFRFGDDYVPEQPLIIEEIQVESATVYFSDVVLDKNDNPLSNVEVSVYAAGRRYSDKTESNGEYMIEVPANELPQIGYISLSITKEKYVPYNSTYKAPLQGGVVHEVEESNFRLDPCPNCLEMGEKSSELFHLGDDNYAGPENSQFQKTTDGSEVDIILEGSDGYDKIAIGFEVKGIQPVKFLDNSSVQFFAGSELVAEELISEDSPLDGSFGTYNMTVDNSMPITFIKFVTRNHGTPGSDYDDWEFTCLYATGDN